MSISLLFKNQSLKVFSLIALVLMLVFTLASAPTWSLTEEPGKESGPAVLTATAQFSPYTLEPSQVAHLNVQLNITAGFKAYADQFKIRVLSPDGFQVGQLEISPLQEFFDKFSKKNRTGVTDIATITAVIEASPALTEKDTAAEVELTYQACNDTFCLFPQTLVLKVPFQAKIANSSVVANKETTSFLSMDLKQVFKHGLLWTFIFVFLTGILTSFTPCIFPMIPITLSVLGRNAHTRTRGQNFLVSNLYVLGIAVTYAIMGVMAASTGALFGSFMSHPIVLTVMCLIFLAMAFSMFGLYEMEAPAFIQNRFSSSSDLTGYSGAFISGVISGVVASPCVGPVLVGILTYIAKTQNLWLGFFLMFVYALGMGQIFLVLGFFSQMSKLLPKSGPWLDGVKHVFGLMMLGVFYYFLNLLLPQRFWDIAFGVGLALISGYFGAFSSPTKIWKWMRKGLLQALVILGGAYIVLGIFDLRGALLPKMIREEKVETSNEVRWQPYSQALLDQASAEGKPVLVDFGADWCAACKELEQYTFADIRFKALAQQFVLLKFDATASSPELDALKEKYEIVGLPTLLFFNRKGELLKELTLTAFEEADPFIQRMKKVQ